MLMLPLLPVFVDFTNLRDAGYVNVLDDENTNISEVNLEGNRQYDHIWINKHTRNIFTSKYMQY
jgi:hypothetical protein